MARLNEQTRILVVFGTRPEAIKMFPVVQALRQTDGLDVRVAVTAQHRELLHQVLQVAGIEPDIDLDLMTPGQSLEALSARLLERFSETLDTVRPDRVIVQGDTLTTMMVTLACYFKRIPLAHVEAGLRSGEIYAPWPEEGQRKIVAAIADMHFAPTAVAAEALRAENVPPAAIHLVGNTVIDALLTTISRLKEDPSLSAQIAPTLDRFRGKRLIAVTAHRRETFGDGMREIAKAIQQLATREDTAIVFPLHPNPHVKEVMRAALDVCPNVALLEPLDYPSFVAMMKASDLLLTDSGGIQEEAPSLGKPVLVLRNTTERPEGLKAGTAKLVGTNGNHIVAEASQLLDDEETYLAMATAHNPYGDGTASRKIAEIISAAHHKPA
ncbi:MAG: UDP-N-acetylglucosamine 2-epimerase (non-hydrolyzing) [Pseudomonadota bacterium]